MNFAPVRKSKHNGVKTVCAHGHLRWPPTADELDALYRSGTPTREIAERYGVAMVTLRQRRRRLGVSLPTERERFNAMTRATKTGCIEWTGSKNGRGYGLFTCERPNHHRSAKTHRIAWEWANQASLLPGSVIMHECDNPCCVNPDHLTLGTHKQNSQQAWERGRRKPIRGEKNTRAQLTKVKVIEARARFVRGESIPKIAEEYGVKYPALYNAVRGRTWKWL